VTKPFGTVLLLLPALLGASCAPAGQAAPSHPNRLAARAAVPFERLRPDLQAPKSGPETIPADVADTLAKAREQMAAKQNRQALEVLEKVLADGNPPAEAYRLAGLACRALGEHDRARENLAAADKLAPDNLLLQKTLGEYAIHAGNAHEALQRLRLALLCSDAKEAKADTAEVVLRLAALLEQQGYLAAAAACYQRLGDLVVTHSGDYADSRLLAGLVAKPERCDLAAGKLLLKVGSDEQAAVLLERAYRYDKTHRDTGLLAVKALVAVGETARAEDIVMEMAREKKLRAQSASAAMVLCRRHRDPALPLRMLSDFLKVRGSNSTFAVALASLAAQYGKADAAARLLSRYRDGEEDDRAVAYRLARLYARSGKPVAAANELASVLQQRAVGATGVWEEISRSPRTAWTGEAIRPIVTAAEQAEGKHRPDLLCIAAMLAEAVEDDADRAAKLLDRALQADKRFAPALEALYDLHLRAGDEAEAVAVVKKAQAAPDEHWFGHYLQGRELLRKGKAAEAVKALEAARERDERNVPVLIQLGAAYARLRRTCPPDERKLNTRRAEERLLAACVLAPSRLSAARALYDLYTALGRADEAGAVIQRFVGDNPDHAEGRLLQARCYIARHDSDHAHELLGQLLEEQPDCVEAALMRIQLETPELFADDVTVPADHAAGIIRRLQKITAAVPDNLRASGLYAAVLMNQHRPADAARVLADARARKPNDPGLVNDLLNALIKAKKTEKARAVIEALIAREDLPGPMERVLVERLLEMDERDQAVATAETFLARPGDKERALARRTCALGAYEKAKRYDRAVEKLDAWIAAADEPAYKDGLRRIRIYFLALAGKTDKAAAAVAEWLDREKGSVPLKYRLAQTLLEAKAYGPAIELLDELIEASPADSDLLTRLWVNRMEALIGAGKGDEFVETEARWIARNPDHPRRADRERYAILVLAGHNRYDDALKLATDWLSRLSRSDPTGRKDWAEQVDRARRLVVSVLREAGRKDEAIRRAKQFVADHPEDPGAYRVLAGALSAADRDRECLRQLEKAYELDPDQTGINNDLGYSWIDRGMNLPQAEKMVRKALLAKPREVAFQDSLGWALYKTGRFGEAKRVFDTIADAPPQDLHPVILDHAGDTCWRLGMDLEAVRMWVRALAEAKADDREELDRETRAVLKGAPKKIAACRRGRSPRLAPVAEGYREPAGIDE